MLVKNTLATLLGLAVVTEAASVHHFQSPALMRRQNRFGGGGNGKNNNNNGGGGQGGQQGGNQNNGGQNNGGNNNNNQASVTCLNANAIQTGSQQTGQNGEIAAGQVESKTYVDPESLAPAPAPRC